MAETSQTPKVKLIETAAQLVYKQGWNGTGINQILSEAKIPKGSFYYYFHSKDDLGVAIVKHHAERFKSSYKDTFYNKDLNGKAAIEAYFIQDIESFSQDEWRWGCPLGSFSNEVADTIERIAAACRESLDHFRQAIESAVERGQKDGSVKNQKHAATISIQIVSLWQGALLLMKTTHSELPLANARQLIMETLL